MMARTQITLDPELHRRARERAAELGISLAEYVRRLVAQDLAGPGPRLDISAVFDLGDFRSSGLPPVGDWDEAVAEALEAEAREEGWLA
jgi:hypothetical protein